MTYTDAVHALGDGILWTTDILFENVGNIFNYAVVGLGAIGLVFWLSLMVKYKKEAKNNPNYME